MAVGTDVSQPEGDGSVLGPPTLTFLGPRTPTKAGDPESPSFVTPSCQWMEARSVICRDLRAGSAHMLANAENYIPQYPNESAEDYEFRLRMASFRNFYGQAVGSAISKMFSQPPTLNDDVPAAMIEHLDDADTNGSHWTLVAEKLVDAAIDEGLAYLIVDYHSVADIDNAPNLTLEQERELGVRPYWVVVPQHRVLGVRYKQVRGRYIMTQFRFMTTVDEDVGSFGTGTTTEITCYEPDVVRKYRKGADGNWLPYGTPALNTLGRVPVVVLNLSPKMQNPYLAVPPMENLAYMNAEHFQIRSDQRRALSVASYPLLALFGVDTKQSSAVKIGPLQSFNFEDSKADMKWVESQGVHLLAGDRELKSLEAQMRTFGLSFENPQMYATATGRNIDASDAIAPLVRWAYRLRDCINTALWLHAQWMKMAKGGTINVNTTFLRNMLTVEGLKLLLEGLKEGALTPKSFLERMKDYGLLADSFDTNKEDSELKAAAEQAAKAAKEALDDETQLRRDAESPPSGEPPPPPPEE